MVARLAGFAGLELRRLTFATAQIKALAVPNSSARQIACS
jgi:hypothetical protein